MKGEYKSWLVFIQYYKKSYLVLISPSKNPDKGYDDWVENYEYLKQYFLESKWEIEWE